MRDVGRSRSKTSFEQRAERKTRAHRREQLAMHDEYWTLQDQLEEFREDEDSEETLIRSL